MPAEQARASFNARFWYAAGGYLLRRGRRRAGRRCRRAGPTRCSRSRCPTRCWTSRAGSRSWRWCASRLLTPVGLRSLAPGHPDYKPKYYGDLRARDAAYHQGTVWAWLIGPFIDAWLKVHPDQSRRSARQFLEGFVDAPGRGVHRLDQRDLRRRSAVHAARLHRAGLERGRGAADLGEDGIGSLRSFLAIPTVAARRPEPAELVAAAAAARSVRAAVRPRRAGGSEPSAVALPGNSALSVVRPAAARMDRGERGSHTSSTAEKRGNLA